MILLSFQYFQHFQHIYKNTLQFIDMALDFLSLINVKVGSSTGESAFWPEGGSL